MKMSRGSLLWSSLSLAVMSIAGCGTVEREGNAVRMDSGQSTGAYADARDQADATRQAARRADWRCGPVVYQVFVDRFGPPSETRLAAKADLYASPRQLIPWDTLPFRGEKDVDAGLWSHELHFWGGDLVTLRDKLDYIEELGADVVYLNPIQQAYTNHKYDAHDFFEVSPEYGTRDDVRALADDLHNRDMRLMLDGVFNHMGATSPHFIEARDDPSSPWRAWFEFHDEAPGYRAWFGVANLPEVRLESEAIRARLWGDDDSAVQGYLRNEGVDGWRLDVAYDLGPVMLESLVSAAHEAREDAWVVGEVWNYPDRWAPPLDGVMNFHAREILMAMSEGRLTGARAARLMESMVEDMGIDIALRSWLILDNHDTDRLASWSPSPSMTRQLTALMMTLPGCPVVYYGSELGMEGVGDPGCRAPMQWDLVTEDNETLSWFRQLLSIRAAHPALRYGDLVVLDTESLFAFARVTDRVDETVIVVANPSSAPISEAIAVPLGKIMSGDMDDQLHEDDPVHLRAGLMTVSVPAQAVRILTLRTDVGASGYTPYGRVH